MARGTSYAGVPPGPLSAYLGVREGNRQASLQELQAALQTQAQLASRELDPLKKQLLQAQIAETQAQAQQRLQPPQPKEFAPPESIAITKMLDSLPPAHPMRPNLEARLKILTTREPRASPQEPAPIAIIGEDGKPKLVSRRDAIGQQPAPRTSIAGTGTFNPQTLEFVAKQYLTGDRQAVQGFARNATARIALQNSIVDEAIKQGLTPEQTAAKMADFAGIVAGSRTVGQRAANISLAATEAQEMIGIVKESSDAFARTNFVPWNMALKAYESGTGTPEIAAFGASVNALVNVYARAINPTGQPTVSDKDHARDVINTVQSPQQVDAVLRIINRELEIAKKAPQTVREATRQGIVGAPKEGDKRKSKSGKDIIFRNGQWEYE